MHILEGLEILKRDLEKIEGKIEVVLREQVYKKSKILKDDIIDEIDKCRGFFNTTLEFTKNEINDFIYRECELIKEKIFILFKKADDIEEKK